MVVEYRKDLFADERDDNLNEIGHPRIRQDILGHVTGRTAYYDDHQFDGLLHMRCVRSPHHHARIRSVDTSAAEAMPGVVRLVRPDDVPVNRNTLLSLIGVGRDDEPVLSAQKVAYRGEPILAVIAETERQARDAVAAVRVDWDVLPHVLDVEEALKPGAPTVNDEYPNNSFDYGPYDHQKLRFGDVEAGFAGADHIVEGEYQMSPIEQAPMETCGAIAAPETNDRFVCHTGTQALFFSVDTTAKLLDISSARLHFIGGTVGGGFGGKVDSQTEPLAVLGAMLTGRPVKFIWDRAEEMQVGAPRGAERWRIKDGVTADGRIIARQFTGFFDSGAYTRLSSYAVQKCTGHLPGPYTIPNVASNAYCVYTNRTPATAMRGFGITGVDFAIECQMDRVAEAVGMDPIELRILNSYRDGDMKAHRRLAKNCALVECCQVAADKSGWRLSPEMASASSMTNGGAERADIPATVIDRVGLIGDRRTREMSTDPLVGGQTETLPQGHLIGGSSDAAPPQRSDMQVNLTHPRAPEAGTPAPGAPVVPSRALPGSVMLAQPAGAVPPAPTPARGPSLPPAARGAAVSSPPMPPAPTGVPASAVSPQGDAAGGAAEKTSSTAPKPRRPGVSRFISGRRR